MRASHARRADRAGWLCAAATLGFLATLAAPTGPAGAETIGTELREVFVGKAAEQAFRLVVVAEGYTAADKAKFFADAGATVNGLLLGPPYSFVSPWLEVHGLFVASAQRGADKPNQSIEVATAFDATFGSYNVDRLLTVDNGKVLSAVAGALPSFDVAIALVNDEKYGGSGGPVTVVSLNAASLDILRHELAHTLAKLADEYETPYPGYPPGDSEPNVTSAAKLSPLKWQAWVDGAVAIPTPIADATGPFAPIGAYEGARFQAKGMFRPAPTCIMRQLGVAFCPICLEAVVGAVADEVLQITAATPAGSDDVVCGSGGCPLFGVAFPPHPSVVVRWTLDDIEVGTGISHRPAPTTLGSHAVRAVVELETPLIRGPMRAALRQERSWTLNVVALPTADAGGVADAPAPQDALDATEPAGPVDGPGGTIRGGCSAAAGAAVPTAPGAGPTSALLTLALAGIGLLLRRRHRRSPR